jgi:hypothetical protein
MKTFKGLKVPEIKPPETQEEWCHIMSYSYDCDALECCECIFSRVHHKEDAFNEWQKGDE